MFDLYKQAAGKVKAPPELIAGTALKIKTAQGNAQKAAPLSRYALYGALAACLIVAIMLPVLMQVYKPGPGIFVTKLDANGHTGQVELIDGFLSFQQESGGLIVIPPPQLSGPGIRIEEWTPERYKAYLGFDVTPGYLPQGMTLAEESAVVYISESGSILRDHYTMRFISDTGALEISVSKGKLPPQSDLGRQEDSVIKGSPLAVGISPDGAAYWAQFIAGGAGFFIKAENITQEDFIKTIYTFFE